MNYALREALRMVEEEGLEQRWARHERNHKALVAGIESLGLEMLVRSENRLWSLNTIKVPEGISDAKVRSALLNEYGIEIGGGLGPLKNKIWRVGLMGQSSSQNKVILLLDALQRILAREGFKARTSAQEAATRRT
jgi:alanine-glyoxylate transaminase/serine-glyoxylate transaminase/serine-pyruvate transaminase